MESQATPAPAIQKRPLSIKKKCLFSMIVLSPFLMVLYLAVVAARTYPVYRGIKASEWGWRGRLFAADPVLGFAPIPNARGSEIVAKGPEIPARFDRDGFRIPASEPIVESSGPPRAIALGCSFTYGAACPAEVTFTHALSRLYQIPCRNAGVPSYGLAQVLILARRLIPRDRPAYVIVQYSPWLVTRSQSEFAPTYYGKVPGPYFAVSESPGAGLSIHPPVFTEWVTEMPVSDYRGTRAGPGDFASFLLRVGGPMLVHDDVNLLIHQLKRLTRLTPPPATDGQRIVREAYGEIATLCKENQSRLIIVVLNDSVAATDPYRRELDRVPGVVVVDAHAALVKRLPVATDAAFSRAYCHWWGFPPKYIDGHPNGAAHQIIALEIASAIRRIENRDP